MKKFTQNKVSKASIRAFCLAIFLGAACTFNAQSQTLSPTKYSIDVDITITSGASIGFLFGASDEGNLYMWQLNCANQPGNRSARTGGAAAINP